MNLDPDALEPQQKFRFLPLRNTDEMVGILLDKALRKLSVNGQPKALQSFLKRERLLHWSAGEEPQEVLSLLSRVGEGKVNLPVVALSRDTSFESWIENTNIPSWRTNYSRDFFGIYPIRLNYRLLLMSFEQPVLDELGMVLFTSLLDQYREVEQATLTSSDGMYSVPIHLQVINEGITFTQDPLDYRGNRLFACRTEFSVGTATYQVPEEEVLEFTPRFVFEEMRYPT